MKRLTICTVLSAALTTPGLACDLCAIYSANEARGDIGKGPYFGVAEQFTHFGTLQEEGHEVRNEVDQYLDSSVSQAFVGYNFTERFGVQFNLPYIYRKFKRPEGLEIDRDSESGIGDASLVGHFQVYRKQSKKFTFAWTVLGGIKFPTGDSDRIKEEFEEVEVPGAPESGIHGHDLTLGSGSYDGIIGTSIFARSDRIFFAGNVQYSLRTEGDFDYEFADDLTWAGGPGYFLALHDEYTVALEAIVSGETKDKDTFRGEKAEDTGITSVFLGPQITMTWSDKLSAEIGVDFPMSLDNTALQAVPDYRVRAAVTFHF